MTARIFAWGSLFLIVIAYVFASERYTVSTSGGWATLRNAPGEYTMGNGATGWTFDIFYTGKAPWYYGYLYGDYNGCGWILNNELSNTGSKGQDNLCSSSGTEFPLNSFASLSNSQPCCDGAGTHVRTAATEYANTGRNAVRNIANDTYVLWRYVTTDGQNVMIRDPHIADGQGDWVFVKRSTLPADLPYEYKP